MYIYSNRTLKLFIYAFTLSLWIKKKDKFSASSDGQDLCMTRQNSSLQVWRDKQRGKKKSNLANI